ncbi:MAG: AMP-binding protein [Bacteroidota bacterium]
MQYTIQHNTYTQEELLMKALQMQADNTVPEWEQTIWAFIYAFINPETDSFINKTSGSTGIPKEIKILKKQAIASAQKTIDFFQLKKNDRLHLCMHAKYIGAKMMVVRALIGEMQLSYSEPTSEALLKIGFPVDFCAAVPLQVQKLVEKNKEGNPFIKTLLIGGASISSSLRNVIIQQATHYYHSFGMTETISHIALQHINTNERFYTLLDGIAIGVDDSNCLWIDAPVIGVNHLQSNDIVELISASQFIWQGRKDYMINSGGVKIIPELIEAKIQPLIPFPFFLSSIPDELLGEKLILLIESKAADVVDKKYLVESMQEILAKYEVPKEIYVLAHFLYTETNKIKRKETTALINV